MNEINPCRYYRVRKGEMIKNQEGGQLTIALDVIKKQILQSMEGKWNLTSENASLVSRYNIQPVEASYKLTEKKDYYIDPKDKVPVVRNTTFIINNYHNYIEQAQNKQLFREQIKKAQQFQTKLKQNKQENQKPIPQQVRPIKQQSVHKVYQVVQTQYRSAFKPWTIGANGTVQKDTDANTMLHKTYNQRDQRSFNLKEKEKRK